MALAPKKRGRSAAPVSPLAMTSKAVALLLADLDLDTPETDAPVVSLAAFTSGVRH